MADVRALAAGFAMFLALAPLLAFARQVMLLLVAGIMRATAELLEAHLLPLLPIDPVYGGAGLRVLGGIEPRGLAVAGWPGQALHALLPAVFGSPDLVPADAVVSALVDPGITVLARVLTAILATSVLVMLAGLAADRLRRLALASAARLAQIWLLLDLAHETTLGIRDLEATGLPFALAALAPVDAQGQRVLLTTHLGGIPDGLVGGANAAVAIVSCLILACMLRTAWRLVRVLARPARLRVLRLPQPGRIVSRLGSMRLARPTLGPGALRLAVLVVLALTVSATPLRTLAEGEVAILLPLDDEADSTALIPVLSPVEDATPEPASPEPVVAASAPPPTNVSTTAPLAVAASPTRGAAPAASAASPTDSSTLLAAASRAGPGSTPPAVALPSPSPSPILAAAPSPSPDVASRGSTVTLEGSGYQYTLRVNGKPMVVRGMGYNPWYASLPVEERRTLYRRDFSAMREIGINTLEGWFQDQFDEVTLDEAHRQGLKVIMPYELNQDYDYADPATRARFRQEVTAWVLRYRNHPAVLMWGPGNEVMHRLIFPSAVQGLNDPARAQRADDFAGFLVELMDMIHQLDPQHPVIYRDAEDLYLARFREQYLRGGVRRPWFVYGTNVYTSRIAEVIEDWPTQGLDAPLLVSEFSPGGAGESDRPRMLGWYWSTIRAHPKLVLGGVVYTWAVRGPEDLDRVFGLTDDDGAPVDGSLTALRQLFRTDKAGKRTPDLSAR